MGRSDMARVSLIGTLTTLLGLVVILLGWVNFKANVWGYWYMATAIALTIGALLTTACINWARIVAVCACFSLAAFHFIFTYSKFGIKSDNDFNGMAWSICLMLNAFLILCALAMNSKLFRQHFIKK